jgi:hypothetical protein
MFAFINSDGLKVDLDPVQTEDVHHASVAFDITVIWSTTLQKTRIEIREFWLEHTELNKFQEELQNFVAGRIAVAKLCDMSLEPVMRFHRIRGASFFEINAQSNYPSGSTNLKTQIDEDELVMIVERMKTWAKWW